MNKELRELLDSFHIVVKKITLRNRVIIIDSGKDKFVIKKKSKDLDKIFQYLKSRSFDYYPKILYESHQYYIFQYIEDLDIPLEEKANDIIKLVSVLHGKTTFYKEIDDDSYKELYESIVDRIDYLFHYYDDMASIIEGEEYMSPSHYYFIRNISKVFSNLSYCRDEIEKWYSIISEKKRVRIVQIHNNLSLDHYLISRHPYFISWDYSKKDLPIYDLLKLYQLYYNRLDFCDLLKLYEASYPLLPEEKILFFVLISIPLKLEFNEREFLMCQVIQKFYDYLFSSEKFISDYVPRDKDVVKK